MENTNKNLVRNSLMVDSKVKKEVFESIVSILKYLKDFKAEINSKVSGIEATEEKAIKIEQKVVSMIEDFESKFLAFELTEYNWEILYEEISKEIQDIRSSIPIVPEIPEYNWEIIHEEISKEIQDVRLSIPTIPKMPDIPKFPVDEIMAKLNELDHRIIPVETPEEIRNKLETLKEDERLDVSAIKGIDKSHTTLSDTIVNRAIGIVDQRTSFLINKVSALQTQVNNISVTGGSGHTIQDEGSNLTARTNLNFVGAGVTATDDSGNNATIVTISGGGASSSSYQQPTSGTVNGTNKIFVFASAPEVVEVDGVSFQKVSSDGTVNWTGTTTITLTIAPNFDIFAIGVGTGVTFVDNEVVSGSGTTYTLTNTPTVGSVHVYGRGQRLKLTSDYSISGAIVTTVDTWIAGDIISDYRK